MTDTKQRPGAHPAPRDYWYPVAMSSEVEDKPFGTRLHGEKLAVVRLDGDPVVYKDLCIHRGSRCQWAGSTDRNSPAVTTAGSTTGRVPASAFHSGIRKLPSRPRQGSDLSHGRALRRHLDDPRQSGQRAKRHARVGRPGMPNHLPASVRMGGERRPDDGELPRRRPLRMGSHRAAR